MNLTIFPYEAHAGLGVIFPAKTFALESESEIYLISPNSTNPKLLKYLKDSKKKLYFIAPNNFHNMHLKPLNDLFEGEFYGPKRASIKSGVKLKKLEELNVKGMTIIPINGAKKLAEVAFYIEELKTVIITDLFFNMYHKMNFSTKMAMKLAGTYHRLGTSRLLKSIINDPKEFIKSIQTLNNLKFDFIIPNHGDKVDKETFHIFARNLKNEKKFNI